MKIKEPKSVKKLQINVVEKMATLITSAFALIAALAWNEAIRDLFVGAGPLSFLATKGPWVYAIFVTFLAVFATIWIGRVSEKVKLE